MKKDDFYETEADRIRRRNAALPMSARLANWWRYHWVLVTILAAALAVAAYMTSDSAVAAPEDYSVAWVGKTYLPDETAQALEAAIAAFGTDCNGDGAVVVRLHQMALDLAAIAGRGSTSGQQEYADLMALNADLECGQSVLFLLEDPAAFQEFSGALIGLDGSTDVRDPAELAVPWTQVLGPLPEGLEGPVYLACRGCWKDGQMDRWRPGRALWDTIMEQGGADA